MTDSDHFDGILAWGLDGDTPVLHVDSNEYQSRMSMSHFEFKNYIMSMHYIIAHVVFIRLRTREPSHAHVVLYIVWVKKGPKLAFSVVIRGGKHIPGF